MMFFPFPSSLRPYKEGLETTGPSEVDASAGLKASIVFNVRLIKVLVTTV